MPRRSLTLAAASAALGLAALAASPAAAAYISIWDSGVANGPGSHYSNWNGSPNNPAPDIVAGAVHVCPPGYRLGPDHLMCWPH
jgi:hypothetical protein